MLVSFYKDGLYIKWKTQYDGFDTVTVNETETLHLAKPLWMSKQTVLILLAKKSSPVEFLSVYSKICVDFILIKLNRFHSVYLQSIAISKFTQYENAPECGPYSLETRKVDVERAFNFV